MRKKTERVQVDPDDEEPEQAEDFEAALLDDRGCGASTHGRRVRARGLQDAGPSELPDEAPPGWPK